MKKKFIRKVGLNLPLDITVPYPAISAAGESDGGWGGHCKPSPVSFMAEALETFGYFAFFIAQNIT